MSVIVKSHLDQRSNTLRCLTQTLLHQLRKSKVEMERKRKDRRDVVYQCEQLAESIYVGTTPHAVTVTTRIIPFLVGDPSIL